MSRKSIRYNRGQDGLCGVSHLAMTERYDGAVGSPGDVPRHSGRRTASGCPCSKWASGNGVGDVLGMTTHTSRDQSSTNTTDDVTVRHVSWRIAIQILTTSTALTKLKFTRWSQLSVFQSQYLEARMETVTLQESTKQDGTSLVWWGVGAGQVPWPGVWRPLAGGGQRPNTIPWRAATRAQHAPRPVHTVYTKINRSAWLTGCNTRAVQDPTCR